MDREFQGVGENSHLVEAQNGLGGPFEAVSGWGPKPRLFVDERDFNTVFNREALNACGVYVDEGLPELYVSGNSVEFWDWSVAARAEQRSGDAGA